MGRLMLVLVDDGTDETFDTFTIKTDDRYYTFIVDIEKKTIGVVE